ncbi:DUF5916 domain-containing protein [Pedobacter immunditicola]|uniref:DUF5916 domain-containing protein n=1 Tax=Pedobacter immunditicola TaxID=3133440 RepID=UPI0030A79130
MRFLYLSILLLFCYSSSVGQNTPIRKKMPAKRTGTNPKIDGLLDDPEWINAPIATGFIENNPTPGKMETADRRTEVKLLYDDIAVYVSARMYANPDSIAQELMTRDQIGNSDYFGIFFDTFLDRINGNGFFVTASGTQFDAKYSQTGNEDPNWNAVWDSEVKIDEKGWTLEMKIPYSALRFSSKDVQTWGLNMLRKRAMENSQTFWNFVDPKVSGLMNQEGTWEGLEKIKAPLRLSFSPYISSYVNHYPSTVAGIKDFTSSFSGGMDVKYGINNSFTLDMTLIPDFGQVQSDNRILNLTPFEVKFNENRSFFTEGTELFNKGDLFYSRRIGASPSYFKDVSAQLQTGETIVKDPQESKVLNATKISGRTAKGLGIGIFNALTNKMFAEVEDAQGNRREIESQPLTNYNIFVLDQSLKNNSSVSIINTNVLRQGSSDDANVTAFLFNLNDKKNKFYINGAGKMSYLTSNGTQGNQKGYFYEAETGKQSGNFTWSYEQKLADQVFDPSDMGFFTNNNFFDQTGILHYNIYKPGKFYNTFQSFVYVNYSRRFKPAAYQNVYVEMGPYIQFKNLWSAELILNWRAEGNDFYESRNGDLYKSPETYGIRLFVNPNRAKAYNFGGNIGMTKQELKDGKIYNFYFFQNLRLNDKLGFGLDLYYEPSYNLVNWVGAHETQSIFSKYDRNTVENSFDAKYSFTNRMGINLRARHYWSDRRNSAFYDLTSTGMLKDHQGPALEGADKNYNVFNIDLIYTWQFAPGSELSVTYKDISESSMDYYTKGYRTNLNNILSGPQNNSLSIKMLYYIDYLDIRKKKNKIIN